MAIAQAKRRLAAIMAADIVGYSRLVEADEAGTLAAIRDLRHEVIDPLLAQSHGRIVKLMGDGAIVEFGSVVDAVACAAAIQTRRRRAAGRGAADRRIVFRIGINLGDVVVDGDDLLGDGVNVAARLEQLCEPGGVLVSGTAYDHLQGKLGLPLDDAGEQQLKNIARPVRIWRLRLDGTKPLAPAPDRAEAQGLDADRGGCPDRAGSHRRRVVVVPTGRAGERPARPRGAAFREHERRSRSGLPRRGRRRGYHHRALDLPDPSA